ncbi:unnamed protein product [Polarella glacialis]|uniref:C3H1-type domain-containing protein n=1 Tax=Polarella glacialis TaxID=89957 RepID=A0A813JGZ5_POLGL|nr:unnamed protein product [Polarella glacialis]
MPAFPVSLAEALSTPCRKNARATHTAKVSSTSASPTMTPQKLSSSLMYDNDKDNSDDNDKKWSEVEPCKVTLPLHSCFLGRSNNEEGVLDLASLLIDPRSPGGPLKGPPPPPLLPPSLPDDALLGHRLPASLVFSLPPAPQLPPCLPDDASKGQQPSTPPPCQPASMPPQLPPLLPEDALKNQQPSSPPPCQPASMPSAFAPVLTSPLLPAPPSQAPSLPAKLAWAQEAQQQVGQPKLLLPCRILRFGAEEGVAQDGAQEAEGAMGDETPSCFQGMRDGSALKFPPGLRPPPNTPSHGSVLHGDGNCRPCAWFWRPNGCENGSDCGHCHVCPEGEIKARKKAKQTIMRLGLATPKVDARAYDLQDTPQGLFASCMLAARLQEDGVDRASERDDEERDVAAMLAAACSHPTCPSPSEFDSTCVSSGTEFEASSSGTMSERMSEYHGFGMLHFPPGMQYGDQNLGAEAFSIPSEGSAAHGSGTCRPCVWFWKPSGCQNAYDCKYCHICDESELKSRKKSKHTMMRLGLVTPKNHNEVDEQCRFALSLESLLQQ